MLASAKLERLESTVGMDKETKATVKNLLEIKNLFRIKAREASMAKNQAMAEMFTRKADAMETRALDIMRLAKMVVK